MNEGPESTDEVFGAAELAFSNGDFERAGDLWASLADADALFNAGNAYREAGRFDDAKRLYRESIAGGVADAHLNLAYILEDEGDDDGAARELAAGVTAGDPGASVETARRVATSDPKRALRLALAFEDHPLVAEAARTVIERATRALSSHQGRNGQ